MAMENLEIEGKNFISAKRAASENSYTADYVGQLIRANKLVGRKVGRSWYVEEESLEQFLKLRNEGVGVSSLSNTPSDMKLDGQSSVEKPEVPSSFVPQVVEATAVEIKSQPINNTSEEVETPAYELLTYVAEEEPELPVFQEKKSYTNIENNIDSRVVHHEVPQPKNREEVDTDVTPILVRKETPAVTVMPKAQAVRGTHYQVPERRVTKRNSFLPALGKVLAVATIVIILVSIGMSLSRVVHYDGSSTSASVGISNIRDIK